MIKRRILVLSLLIVVIFAGVSCGGVGRGEKESPAPRSTPSAVPESSQKLLAILPGDGEVDGWSLDDEARFFHPENLWEFIDGAADGYLTYGFQEVVTADFSQEGTGYQAVIDIYRMKDNLNAFGIYAQERNPDYDFIDCGVEGYIGGTVLNFWAGRHYVKITVFEENNDLIQEMRKLADSIARKITPPGSMPGQEEYFPRTHQQPHTFKYIPADVLGQDYFRNGFEAEYRVNTTDYKIVLIVFDDSDAAKEGLSLYRRFISTSGSVSREITSPGEEGFVGEDSFYGLMMATRKAHSIAVILGMPSENAGASALTELMLAIP